MVRHFDHVTIVVNDVAAAKRFFGLLGFSEAASVVIRGKQFSDYMGVDGIEAEHVTLVPDNVSPRTEVQLLKYRHPDPACAVVRVDDVKADRPITLLGGELLESLQELRSDAASTSCWGYRNAVHEEFSRTELTFEQRKDHHGAERTD
jgi:hypothetical protein